MPILENEQNPPTDDVNSPGAPGILSYFRQGQLRSTGVQMTTEGDITAAGTITGDTIVVTNPTPGWFNVKTYGATGDGTTNDTVAIQAAITAAGATGGTVYFPPTTTGYLLNSAALTMSSANVTLRGEGGEASKLVLGASFVDTTMVNITAANCTVIDLWFEGDSTTPTTNPVADAIRVIGVRRTKISRCSFFYINGWAVQIQSTSASATSNPRGTQISQVYLSECAGGVRFFGDTTQNYQMNCQITDFQAAFTGVTTGASANLDVIMVEDAWDVLIENAIAWMSNGTGSSLHVKGDCAATFVTNLDALGSQAGPCVLIESDAGGFPQNVQITGGVIQQGTIGLRVTGTARHVRVTSTRIINNLTHGISIENTVSPVYLTNLFFATSGQGASGSNYDINWSGTSTGSVDRCYFASPITAIGVAGVQQSVNIAADEEVTFSNVSFDGVAAASTNWFTNLPDAVLLSGADGRFNFRTRVDFTGQIARQPAAASDVALSSNVSAAAFDNFRILGDGDMEWGSGSGARDTTLYRSAADILATDDDFAIKTAGKGLQVTEGANAKMGASVLVAGTVTVATTAVTANSRIFLTSQVDGGTPGFQRVSARVAATSFTITSSDAADTSTVGWLIVEPA